jgi:hypothetical protein
LVYGSDKRMMKLMSWGLGRDFRRADVVELDEALWKIVSMETEE